MRFHVLKSKIMYASNKYDFYVKILVYFKGICTIISRLKAHVLIIIITIPLVSPRGNQASEVGRNFGSNYFDKIVNYMKTIDPYDLTFDCLATV